MDSKVCLLFCTFTFLIIRSSAKTFKLGVLIPFTGDRALGHLTAGAVTMAMDYLNTDPSLTKIREQGHNFTFTWRDTKSKMDKGLRQFVEMWAFSINCNAEEIVLQQEEYEECQIDAFIGPAIDDICEPAATLADEWGIPMISFGCGSSVLSNKQKFSTFARTVSPYKRLAPMIHEIMREFDWTRVMLVESSHHVWQVTSSDIQDFLINHGVDVRTTPFFETDLEEHHENYKQHHFDTLNRIREEARVFILLCDSSDVRNFMLNAYDMGMINGDFAFITIDFLLTSRYGSNTWQGNDGRDSDAVVAFEGLLDISKHEPHTPAYEKFAEDVRKYTALPPFNYTMKNYEKVDPHAHALYDAMLVYGIALDKSLKEGVNPCNTREIAQRVFNNTYDDSIHGILYIDESGDAFVNYTLRNLRYGDFKSIFHYSTITKRLQYIDKGATILWPGGGQTNVLGRPECGWENEYCGVEVTVIVSSVACVTLFILIISLALFIYRTKKRELMLFSSMWKINYQDLVFISNYGSHSRSSKYQFKSTSDMLSARFKGSDMTGETQIYTKCANFDGQKVAVKELQKSQIILTKEIIKELNEVRCMRHANLNQFIGACVEPNYNVIVSQYASKGSLWDVIHHEHISLDNMFKLSFASDMVEGMQYIHDSVIEYHGNLKSSNVVVDNRWTCKIADFGLRKLREGEKACKVDDHSYYFRQLWTAPEILRQSGKERRGSKTGDMYSFAIILQELILRSDPFGLDSEDPKEVIKRVAAGEIPPYRPPLQDRLEEDARLVPLIVMCWNENPLARSSFTSVGDCLKRMNKGRHGNLVEQMMRLMQKHSDHLEEVVEERTQQLAEEQRKTEELLCRMLPQSVAERLKRGYDVRPETYSSVTVFFSDIVGFTGLAASSTPLQVVDFLNDLYTCFDYIIDTYDVYKVETIGDAYMCVSGLPIPNGNAHAGEIGTMALDLLSTVRTFRIRHMPGKQLQLRIGMHSGPVVAGVVGLKMPRYCLFGDTVNYASRMESSGLALRIHVSSECAQVLQELGGYNLQSRGEIAIKGKGNVNTYFLQGKEGFNKSLPDLTLAAKLEDHEFK